MTWTSPEVVVAALGIYLLLALAVGLYFGRRGARTAEGYFVAGRKLGVIPTSFSMMSTIISGGTFLATIGLFSTLGSRYLGYMLSFAVLAPLLFYVVGRRLWPIAKARGYVTLQDLFHGYYGSRYLRYAGAIVGIVFLVPYFASNGVALGLVLESTVGVPYAAGVWGMILGTVLYSAYGGMFAVAYTDVLQGAIALLCSISMVIALVAAVGGPLDLVRESGQIASVPVGSGDMILLFYGWLFFIGLSTVTMPDRTTRMLSLRGLPQLRRSALMLCALLTSIVLIYLVLGLASSVLIPAGDSTDLRVFTALAEYAPYLVPVFVVVIWATGMSTLDSGLIASTTMFSRDILGRRGEGAAGSDPAGARRTLRISRVLMVVLSLAAVLIAIGRPPAIWALIGMAVSIYIQYLPALFGALYWRRGTKLAAEVSWTASILGTIAIYLFAELPDGVFPGVLVLGPNVLLYVGISLMTKRLPAHHVEAFHQIHHRAGIYPTVDPHAPDAATAASSDSGGLPTDGAAGAWPAAEDVPSAPRP